LAERNRHGRARLGGSPGIRVLGLDPWCRVVTRVEDAAPLSKGPKLDRFRNNLEIESCRTNLLSGVWPTLTDHIWNGDRV
jgi:hypothetical protein